MTNKNIPKSIDKPRKVCYNNFIQRRKGMSDNVFNNIKQELENTVNADYKKLNETGKNVYLETRKTLE